MITVHPSLRVSAILAMLLASLALLWVDLAGRREGEREAATERLEQERMAFAQKLHRATVRADSAIKSAAAERALAIEAQRHNVIVDASHIEVDGIAREIPAPVVNEIAHDRVTIAAQAAAIDLGVMRGATCDSLVRADAQEIALLKRRVPRFGFKSGAVLGTIGTLLVRFFLAR